MNSEPLDPKSLELPPLLLGISKSPSSNKRLGLRGLKFVTSSNFVSERDADVSNRLRPRRQTRVDDFFRQIEAGRQSFGQMVRQNSDRLPPAFPDFEFRTFRIVGRCRSRQETEGFDFAFSFF